MLDATRIASGGVFPVSPAPTDLASVVREATEALAPLFRKNGCALVVSAEPGVVGKWDAMQLDELLWCLLDNAAKFGAGKPIEVTVRKDAGGAMLSVRDHGQGIAPDRVGHIFDVFERAVPAMHYGGLGLGLFIAKAIAEAHGGSLSVDSRPGDGATFTVRLPLQPPVTGESASAASH
jgi:signal transduction histidine kinase